MAKTVCTADAAVRLMLHYPFWCELYYSMKVIETDDIPTLATNSRVLYVNPRFWRELPLELKISALAHETAHKMLHHPTRMHPEWDRTLSNVAMDIVVNGLLAKNGFKLGPTWVQPVEKYDNWTWEAIYLDLIKQYPPPPPQGGSGGDTEDGTGGLPKKWQGAWQDVQAFKGSAEEVENHEAAVEQAVAKAIVSARAMGHTPAGIEMAMTVTYTLKEEPWYNHLQRFMQSLVVANYNWARANKRYAVLHRIVAPANYHEALGEVVVAVDASGSCYTAAEQAGFTGHINAILAEAKPQKVHVLYFDTKVHRHEELDPGTIEFESNPVGGGGTSFVDIFDWCEREGVDPAVLIVLTDMMGTFPNQGPGYPVIWANTYDKRQTAPFGETLFVH